MPRGTKDTTKSVQKVKGLQDALAQVLADIAKEKEEAKKAAPPTTRYP